MCQKGEFELKRHALSILESEGLLAGVEQLHANFYAFVDLHELQFGREISDIPPLLVEHV